MAFVSDSEQLRTWDPETGWELFRIPTGPYISKFELRHPEEKTIYITGECKVEDTGQRNAQGVPIARMRYRIGFDSPRRPISDSDKKMVEEALNAFGYIHNGPIGPVEVIFAWGPRGFKP